MVELRPLVIDPRTIQLGRMSKEEEVVQVPLALGRNGGRYFRIGSVEEILNYKHFRFRRLKLGGKDFGYRLESERRLHQQFIERSLDEWDDFVLGADCRVEDGALKYDPHSLAVWGRCERSKYKIAEA